MAGKLQPGDVYRSVQALEQFAEGESDQQGHENSRGLAVVTVELPHRFDYPRPSLSHFVLTPRKKFATLHHDHGTRGVLLPRR